MGMMDYVLSDQTESCQIFSSCGELVKLTEDNPAHWVVMMGFGKK
jgi:hypothetical protein